TERPLPCAPGPLRRHPKETEAATKTAPRRPPSRSVSTSTFLPRPDVRLRAQAFAIPCPEGERYRPVFTRGSARRANPRESQIRDPSTCLTSEAARGTCVGKRRNYVTRQKNRVQREELGCLG